MWRWSCSWKGLVHNCFYKCIPNLFQAHANHFHHWAGWGVDEATSSSSEFLNRKLLIEQFSVVVVSVESSHCFKRISA